MKALTIVLALILLPILLVAENPDSRPSISIGVGGYSSWGNYSRLGFDQDQTGRNVSFGLGLRVPISQNATFWGSFGYDDARSEGKANIFYYQSISNRNFVSFAAGITLYFGTSINK